MGAEKGPSNPLYEKKPKVFGVGQALPPRTPLNRYVKWPKYVRLQRARRVLQKRLKVPPAINQFNKTLDKNLATNLFKVLMKYRPKDDAQKKERLTAQAEAEAAGKEVESKKPVVVKFGINHITYLVEQGKAQLVCIAHDVDPVELVIWLPALCKQMNVPYCIVKGKARLGAVVHKKTATALALTAIKNEDKMEFSKLVEAIKASYNDVFQKTSRTWGGGIMGVKSQVRPPLASVSSRASSPSAPRLRFKRFFRRNLGVFCRRARWSARALDFEVVKASFDGASAAL